MVVRRAFLLLVAALLSSMASLTLLNDLPGRAGLVGSETTRTRTTTARTTEREAAALFRRGSDGSDNGTSSVGVGSVRTGMTAAEGAADEDNNDEDTEDEEDVFFGSDEWSAVAYNGAGIAKRRRRRTDSGIDLSDPSLYEKVDLKGDSSSATVIGMAVNYPLSVHERFVGSLRRSGFKGNILLLVEANPPEELKTYFGWRRVQYSEVEMADECAGERDVGKFLNKRLGKEHCPKAYPDMKLRWARYPMLRDLLSECESCTGPVLYLDVRDSFFQRDPFGPDMPPVAGLQVYQEHETHRTSHWFVAEPLQKCKGVYYDEPNLCSGSTVGTRAAMLRYLEIMYAEILEWLSTDDCTFSDQPVHNYLYYSGQLPFARSVENQSEGSVVNTVYIAANDIVKRHVKEMSRLHDLPPANKGQIKKALKFGFAGSHGRRWIGEDEFRWIDDEGYFLNFDGSRSPAVHKWDRFGVEGSYFYQKFVSKQKWYNDAQKSPELIAKKEAQRAREKEEWKLKQRIRRRYTRH